MREARSPVTNGITVKSETCHARTLGQPLAPVPDSGRVAQPVGQPPASDIAGGDDLTLQKIGPVVGGQHSCPAKQGQKGEEPPVCLALHHLRGAAMRIRSDRVSQPAGHPPHGLVIHIGNRVIRTRGEPWSAASYTE